MTPSSSDDDLTERQRAILQFIVDQQRDRGYPPSVREIGEAVGLTSPSTVHSHLATLQRRGVVVEVHVGLAPTLKEDLTATLTELTK